MENFDQLSFERKVDVLVAQHIFKYEGITIEWKGAYEGKGGYWSVHRVDGAWNTGLLCYSTLLTSAWEIVRKFEYMYLFKSMDFKAGQWECKLHKDQSPTGDFQKGVYYAWAETEMLVICYAGLKAVGFDIEGFLKEEGK